MSHSALVFRAGLAAALVGIGLFAAVPELDLWAAAFFYDGKHFPARGHALVEAVRTFAFAVPALVALIGFGAIVGPWLLPARSFPLTPRSGLAVLMVYALAPGLLVNGVLKEVSHRPRPVHISTFGGAAEFKAYYDFSGSCRSNCSFVSGEVAAAASTITLALVAPAPLAPLLLRASVLFTLLVAIMRMGQGGHFLSDVVFAALVTVMLAALIALGFAGRSSVRLPQGLRHRLSALRWRDPSL